MPELRKKRIYAINIGSTKKINPKKSEPCIIKQGETMKNIIAGIMLISLVLVMMLMAGCGKTAKGLVEATRVEPAKEEVAAGQLQQLAKEVGEYAGKLKKLIKRMSAPAHQVPGDAGAGTPSFIAVKVL